jgi:3-oxoacyl-[acyl-carrier protein] reductase
LQTESATAVVTGAGQGIGRATSEALARAGFHVVAVDIDPVAADQTARAVNGTAVALDVCDEPGVLALADSLERCDVLVSNAGIWRFTALLDTPVHDAEDVLRVNVVAPLIWLKALAPIMERSGGGCVVHLASSAARAVATGVGIYPASKAAVIALTEQAALELGSRGIRVNAVAPGRITTEATADRIAEQDAGTVGPTALPLGRWGTPEDIAEVIAFLCSPAAAYMTGQVLWVDGGLTIGTNEFLRSARQRPSGPT